ncbi:MAG TPA: spore germination protein GerW family protein [Dehalococcoidia bacterium]|nr:spore germination protein GerW family protein [Dehalococcoidia bacterium]
MDITDAADELVRQVSGIPQELGASACFGEAVVRDGHTLIPVARVNFGYGLGFGGGQGKGFEPGEPGTVGQSEGSGGGGGGGGGGSSTPVAVIDISESGVRIEPIEDKTRMAMAGITMVAWNAFWVLWTIRTVVRERAKTRKLEIESGKSE